MTEKITIFDLKEHGTLTEEQVNLLSELNIQLPNKNDNPEYLGLASNSTVGFYIGVKWVVENELIIKVNPKINKVDYLTMFMECFKNPLTKEHINKIYQIDFDKKPIDLPANSFELTPLLIIHFLNVVKVIIKKGLKKDYVWFENNLSSKMKGKLLLNKHIKQNLINSRLERNYCRYQSYTVDCLENRIIKKALSFIGKYLSQYYSYNHKIFRVFNLCKASFNDVSEDVTLHQLRTYYTKSFFKEYKSALKIARMILRQFDYSTQNIFNTKHKFPPFYINMALLFELYIFIKLDEAFPQKIDFQYHGNYGNIDFLDIENRTIIDTKYKTQYSSRYEIDDIRQLSGYARDTKLLKKLNIIDNPYILDCVIIYPNKHGKLDIDIDNFKKNSIKQFYNFYKYGVQLPTINN